MIFNQIYLVFLDLSNWLSIIYVFGVVFVLLITK